MTRRDLGGRGRRADRVRHAARLALGVAAAVALAGCAAIPGPLGSGPRTCLPHFAYAEGWLGGDAVYSIPVPTGTSRHETIWVFGDTYVGAPGARTREGAALVHNSVARSRCENDGRFDVEYAWREDASGAPAAIFEAERERHYLWPFDGFFLGDQLHVLLLEVRSDTPRGPFGLPIRITRTLVARVENPDDPPVYWRVELRALTRDGEPLLTPGLYVERGYVHMLATPNTDDGVHPRFLVRLPLEALERWPDDLRGALETFSNRGAWERGLHAGNARVLMRDNATELSVDRLGQTGRYFAVYGAPAQTADDGAPSATPAIDGGSIFVRTAVSLTGPWSERRRLYVMPEALEPDTGGAGRRICYAAKAHAEHSPEGVLAMTYVCNLAPGPGGDVWETLEEMQTRMDVYRPRVVTHPWPLLEAFAPASEATDDGR